MAKTKTVAEQSKTAQINSFTGVLNTDLHPMLQPNDTLTDCLNGTLITYNGNENMLQNDMGNYELKDAKLPEGYIPMGIKEHQGVLYTVLMNPITNKVQIGSYPSPRTNFNQNSSTEEYTISPVEIGKLDIIETIDDEVSEPSVTQESAEAKAVFSFFENEEKDATKNLFSKLDFSKSSTIFTKDFHENSMLNFGDKYLLDKTAESNENAPFQSLEYFSIDKENSITPVEQAVIDDDSKNIDVVEMESKDYNDVL